MAQSVADLVVGKYRITSTIEVVQPERYFMSTQADPNCNNVNEEYGGKVSSVKHCARVAPVVISGPTVGERAVLWVPSGTGLEGPVVKLTNPINENINMNQVSA